MLASNGRLEPVEHVGLVERPVEAALAAGAVVSRDEDQRVVELADALEAVDDAADLVVDVLELGGEHLHLAGVQPPALVVVQRVPGRDLGDALGELGVLGERTPSRFWLARICSRATSQPMSNLPR